MEVGGRNVDLPGGVLPDEARRRVGIGLVLGLFPLYFVRRHLFVAGFPYDGDGISNLFPALLVRQELARGAVPYRTDLWYGGEVILHNPLFKGFYPPAWPIFVPGIPLLPAMKVLLAVHYVAVPAIAYWYLREEFSLAVAAPFALTFVLPMAAFMAHYEKTLGWPWVILLAFQCTPSRLTAEERWPGVLAGVAVGALLLVGSSYHFFYAGILLVVLVVATKAWTFGRRAAIGALVGLPKLVFSILPVLLSSPSRPAGGRSVTVKTFVGGLLGWWVDLSARALETGGAFSGEGYAGVGLGVLVLACVGGAAAYYAYDKDPSVPGPWWVGLGAAALLFVLLATRWSFLYQLPGMSTFRVGARAMAFVGVCTLLAARCGLRTLEGSSVSGSRVPVQVTVGLLLVLSLASGGFLWATIDTGRAAPTEFGQETADRIAAAGCESAWIEGSAPRDESLVKTPSGKSVGYGLLRRGVALQAVNYGKIGQEYSTHRDGELTFDVLLVGVPLPDEGNVTLSGGWGSPRRGTVPVDEFTLFERHERSGGVLYIYTTGECGR